MRHMRPLGSKGFTMKVMKPAAVEISPALRSRENRSGSRLNFASHSSHFAENDANRNEQIPIANSKEEIMKRIALVAIGVTVAAGVAAYMGSASGQSNADAAPIYGIKLPDGYRDWRLISVKQLTGKQLTGAGGELKQLRAELGNDLAVKAFRDGTLPFPDGAIIAALHWNEDSSDFDNQALAAGFPGLGLQSSFAGAAVNVQFMVKDSKKYAASGGWGFADFTNGKPGNEALHATCFPCHQPAKGKDYVFTRYAPTP
jgi:hypothetical protein